MKRLLLAAIVALALSGCAQFTNQPAPRPADTTVKVSIVNGELVPDPLIVVFGPGTPGGRIVWELQGNATFPADGIRIDGVLPDLTEGRTSKGRPPMTPPGQTRVDRNQREIVECRRESPKVFSCQNRKGKPGIYKYTITVESGGESFWKDPPIVNMN
jgi:hypothetical protein